MLSTLQGTALLLVVLVFSGIWRYLPKLQTVQHIPGIRPPFTPLGLPGVLFKTSWWNMGIDAHWTLRRTLYKNAENVSVVPFFIGSPVIYTSNLDVARQVIIGGYKTDFIKPVSASRALLCVSPSGCYPSHSNDIAPTYRGACVQQPTNSTATTYYDMMRAEGWHGAKEVDVSAMHSLTFKSLGVVALDFLTIGIHLYRRLMVALVQTPKMKRFEPAMSAHEVLTKFMHEQVTKRREDISNGVVQEVTVFNLILKANHDEESKHTLDDLEVLGNVWVLLFAGHETTAHALAATLVFLSIYEDIQQDVYDQIKEVLDGRSEATVEDYTRLGKVLGVFFEALRMFRTVHIMIREATKDTVLQIPNPLGQDGTTSMAVPKGMNGANLHTQNTTLDISTTPTCISPPDGMGYRPNRKPLPRPRACIRRKFATIEEVSFVMLLLRDWEVKPILNKGETKEQWIERALNSHVFVTLGIKDVPLKFYTLVMVERL
ncbi:cytochrome P450 [Mucidula mucida]|nr:cytochrome P450 [Mucidula mucida]